MTKGKAKDRQEERSVFRPDGARRLQEGLGEELTSDERALLLALISADTEAGESLNDEERAALDKLVALVEDYDAEELMQAVRRMVTSQSRENQKLVWPELRRGRRKHRSSED